MPTYRTALPDLYLTRLAFLDEVLFDPIELADDRVNEVFRVLDMGNRPLVRTTSVASFGTVPIKQEGANVAYDEIAAGYDVTYQADTYELAFRTSKEALDDEQEEVISDTARALGESMAYTYNVDHANIYNNGFTTTAGSPDGVVLFSTAHPLVGGGTEQNTLTTAADLSVSSIRDALNDISDTTDDAGKRLNWKARILLVSAEQQWLAKELVQSSTNAEGANPGVINAFKDDSLRVVVWGDLTDADAWFLLAEPSRHNIRTYWRERPNVMHDWDFDASAFKVKIRARWQNGWSDWKGTYGVAGA